jgi:hypothetical protein
VETARNSLASSGLPARQNSGMFQVTRAPTLTGHCTLAVLSPARAAASQRVATRMSSLYQYQPPWFWPSGSNVVLAKMPWVAGDTPVISVVWLR